MSSVVSSGLARCYRTARLSPSWLSTGQVNARWLSVKARALPNLIPTLSTVADVTAVAELLYTPSFLTSPTAPSVSQISSFYSPPPATALALHPLLTLRVDGKSPRSAYDWFALNLSRARADLIVLTGAILRDEPLLTGNVLADYKPVLDEWRRQVWGRQRPAAVCVLTAGPMNYTHPLFAGTEGDVFVYTTGQYFHALYEALQSHSSSRPPLCAGSSTQHITIPLRHLQALTPASTAAAAATTAHQGSDRPIHIISPYIAPSLLSLVQHFRRTHPHIAVECGPSTTLPHYARHANQHIDTLLLSKYDGPLTGSVAERCVVPDVSTAGLSGGGRVGSRGCAFGLSVEWVAEHHDCLSVAQHGEWRFEWHRSKRAAIQHSR